MHHRQVIRFLLLLFFNATKRCGESKRETDETDKEEKVT